MPRLPRPTDRQQLARPQRPSAMRPGARPSGPGRRVRPVKRASAGLNPTRAGALLALLVACAGIYGAASSEAFAARTIEVHGATLVEEAEVVRAAAVDRSQNLFLLATGPVRERVEVLPTVLRADVTVGLPDRLIVRVEERRPLLVWATAERRFLVDEAGLLFLELGAEAPAAVGDLPVMTDERAASGTLRVGTTLDRVDLDASLRLGSLRPADLGSGAAQLEFRVDDGEGYTVRAGADGWVAVFGFYTPTLRTTELIPGQVRLLRSLLDGREADVLKVVLADDRNGTYIPRSTPEPGATTAP